MGCVQGQSIVVASRLRGWGHIAGTDMRTMALSDSLLCRIADAQSDERKTGKVCYVTQYVRPFVSRDHLG